MSISASDPISELAQDSNRDLVQLSQSQITQLSHTRMGSERSDSPLSSGPPPGLNINSMERPIPTPMTSGPSRSEIKNELGSSEPLISLPIPQTAPMMIRPGHPPVFDRNVAQQSPPGPQYSPRAYAGVRKEELENLRTNMTLEREPFQPPVLQMTRSFRPRAPTLYQQFTPPAYMFKLLGENLRGLIMGCTDETKDECLREMVFGLPAKHWDYIKDVPPGTSVYLFNYNRRCLYGIFQSVGEPQWNFKPYGWSPSPRIPTRFPAQIRVERSMSCPSLHEVEYGPILEWRQNYITFQKFSFELDLEQVQALNQLFQKTKEEEPDREEPPVLVQPTPPPPPPHFQAYQPRPVNPVRRGIGMGRYRGGRTGARGRRGGGGNTSEAQHPIARHPTSQSPVFGRSPVPRALGPMPPPGMGNNADIYGSQAPPPMQESLI
eukprot:g5910.t1